MHFPSKTEASLFFPCTAGTRGVTPNPTPSPPRASLSPPAHRAGMLRAPLMGRDLSPQFRAHKDKLWQLLLWQYKKLLPPAVCLFGGYPLLKGSTCQHHSYLTTKSSILISVVHEGGFNLQHRVTYGKEEEQTSGNDFLGWHAKLHQIAPVSILVTPELFQASEARSCESNHSKTTDQIRSVSDTCTEPPLHCQLQHHQPTSFIPRSLTG